MRPVVLLIALLSACAAPKVPPPKTAAPPKAEAPKPTCFAPAGTYLSFAVLKRHNCRTELERTIGTVVETVAPNSIPCGLKQLRTTIAGVPALMLFMVGTNGMAGSMALALPDCVAFYKIRFIRLGGKGKEI